MKTLIAAFNDNQLAESALNELEDYGYEPKDISVITKDRPEFHSSKGGVVSSATASGFTTGGIIGGLAGLLVGLGAFTLPGIGALLIAGPLATMLGLTGAAATTLTGAATGAFAGGLVGALMGLGLPEDTAREYEKHIKNGAVVLAVGVTNEDQSDEVRSIFNTFEADQIRSVVMPA